MSVCIAVIHLLVIFFISSSVRDPKNDFLLLAILNSAAVTVLITVSQCKEMHFFQFIILTKLPPRWICF